MRNLLLLMVLVVSTLDWSDVLNQI